MFAREVTASAWPVKSCASICLCMKKQNSESAKSNYLATLMLVLMCDALPIGSAMTPIASKVDTSSCSASVLLPFALRLSSFLVHWHAANQDVTTQMYSEYTA